MNKRKKILILLGSLSKHSYGLDANSVNITDAILSLVNINTLDYTFNIRIDSQIANSGKMILGNSLSPSLHANGIQIRTSGINLITLRMQVDGVDTTTPSVTALDGDIITLQRIGLNTYLKINGVIKETLTSLSVMNLASGIVIGNYSTGSTYSSNIKIKAFDIVVDGISQTFLPIDNNKTNPIEGSNGGLLTINTVNGADDLVDMYKIDYKVLKTNPTFISSGSNIFGGSTDTILFFYIPSTNIGDLIMLIATRDIDALVLTPPIGYNLLTSDNTPNMSYAIYWRIVDGNEVAPTLQWNTDLGACYGTSCIFRGVTNKEIPFENLDSNVPVRNLGQTYSNPNLPLGSVRTAVIIYLQNNSNLLTKNLIGYSDNFSKRSYTENGFSIALASQPLVNKTSEDGSLNYVTSLIQYNMQIGFMLKPNE